MKITLTPRQVKLLIEDLSTTWEYLDQQARDVSHCSEDCPCSVSTPQEREEVINDAAAWLDLLKQVGWKP